MSEKIPALCTTGRVADMLGQPLHRIQYILRSRPDIKATATAGTLRLFDDEAVNKIKLELRKINKWRGRKS
jgi:hypothetical protein